MKELKEINETLKRIEDKIEDKNHSRLNLTNIFDPESLRKEREEKRNKEFLKLQEKQIKILEKQSIIQCKLNIFTIILCLATTLYALSYFLQIIIQFENPMENVTNLGNKILVCALEAIIVIVFIALIFVGIILGVQFLKNFFYSKKTHPPKNI